MTDAQVWLALALFAGVVLGGVVGIAAGWEMRRRAEKVENGKAETG